MLRGKIRLLKQPNRIIRAGRFIQGATPVSSGSLADLIKSIQEARGDVTDQQ